MPSSSVSRSSSSSLLWWCRSRMVRIFADPLVTSVLVFCCLCWRQRWLFWCEDFPLFSQHQNKQNHYRHPRQIINIIKSTTKISEIQARSPESLSKLPISMVRPRIDSSRRAIDLGGNRGAKTLDTLKCPPHPVIDLLHPLGPEAHV